MEIRIKTDEGVEVVEVDFGATAPTLIIGPRWVYLYAFDNEGAPEVSLSTEEFVRLLREEG